MLSIELMAFAANRVETGRLRQRFEQQSAAGSGSAQDDDRALDDRRSAGRSRAARGNAGDGGGDVEFGGLLTSVADSSEHVCEKPGVEDGLCAVAGAGDLQWQQLAHLPASGADELFVPASRVRRVTAQTPQRTPVVAQIDDQFDELADCRDGFRTLVRGREVGQQVERQLFDFRRGHYRRDIEALDHQLGPGCRVECDEARIRILLLEILRLSLVDETPECRSACRVGDQVDALVGGGIQDLVLAPIIEDPGFARSPCVRSGRRNENGPQGE